MTDLWQWLCGLAAALYDPTPPEVRVAVVGGMVLVTVALCVRAAD